MPYHLLISVDPELLNCAFVWVHQGELPVYYPLEAFSEALSTGMPYANREKFHGDMGRVVFPVPASEIVKVDFDPEPIEAMVHEWLLKVRAEGACATQKEGAD